MKPRFPGWILAALCALVLPFTLRAQTDINVSNTTYSSGQSHTVQASNSILATPGVMVAAGAAIVFRAGVKVTLGPGFSALTGSSFLAQIGTVSGNTSAPTAPTNLVGTATINSVTLSWSPSQDDVGVVAYRVQRGGQTWTLSLLTFTETGLLASTPYGYTVVALDAAGNVSPPASVTVTTDDPEEDDPNNPTKLNIHIPLK